MNKLPSTAIFGFDETGVLHVYSSAAEAVLAWEGIDAESDAVRFYDARGASLMPRSTTPNRSRRILGLFRWAQSGAYELVPSVTMEDPFALALYEARALEANEWFSSLELLRSDLRENGVDVDFRPAG
ncbi:MAG: hypothetical protein KF871_01690 [Hydrogenophaga sp.]|uniref:hypothetical protein n=1 Tax=Hydrogenophaga sp. TaxID=1904254 RepID=UPI001DB09A28|nr:hypothetical protein [Hydrogenophaga sp.]MBX3608582.1 hypothetical protein [Hydrogenophaga sp.]